MNVANAVAETPPPPGTGQLEPGGTARSSQLALAGLSLAMLLSSFGTSVANVGLPRFAEAFGASFPQVQWIVLAYLLAVTSLIVGAGRLGDSLGRRRLLLAGIAVFMGSSILCGMAPSLWLLVGARFAQGTGAAAMMALVMALVGDAVPGAQRGRAMGLLGTMSAIGTALGPSLGGFLIARFDWPAIFLVNVPLGLLAFVLLRNHLPADRSPRTARRLEFDASGTLLLAATLAAYALAMTIRGRDFGLVNAALLVGAAAGLGLFVRTERRARSPLIRLAMFRDRSFSASFAMSALVSTVLMATLVVGPFYLSRALLLDSAAVGLALSVGPLSAALGGVPAGRIVDRFGASRAVTVGLVGLAIGTLLLASLPSSLGVAGYIVCMIVVTLGYALFQTGNNTLTMASSRREERGVVSGMLNLSRNLGLITGASLMGAVFAMSVGKAEAASAPPEMVAGGLHVTFAVGTLLVVAALLIQIGNRASAKRQPDRGSDL